MLSVASAGDEFGVISEMGGYILRITEASEDAVPMLVPTAAPEEYESTPAESDEESDVLIE